MFVFFFKQKTAYEMRISDWSSDVCSSDLYVSSWLKCHHPAVFACGILNSQPMGFYAPAQLVRDAREHGIEVRGVDVNASGWDNSLERKDDGRSEEHTSELQSLMRISYAVFCLKKKTTIHEQHQKQET